MDKLSVRLAAACADSYFLPQKRFGAFLGGHRRSARAVFRCNDRYRLSVHRRPGGGSIILDKRHSLRPAALCGKLCRHTHSIKFAFEAHSQTNIKLGQAAVRVFLSKHYLNPAAQALKLVMASGNALFAVERPSELFNALYLHLVRAAEGDKVVI